MDKLIKKSLLNHGKSTIQIKLLRHTSGKMYVQIQQTIEGPPETSSEINLNPALLPEILTVLQLYQNEIVTASLPKKPVFSQKDQQRMVHWYLKGVSAKDIGLLFNTKEEIIHDILLKNEIELAENKVPTPKKKRFRFRRKH
ncbi:hypothetical protein [Arundinibacter roseus]|uniref:Uncharacterized protein n=1 Tax=Arundinibacter roseus TaxID=2070510 RepID=A0A4R4KDM6_9BACT|nr:hypothetical protein [Arundinibacter roseus]TDB66044.1 hypothetical protein EZE20_09800 [Arundinibacter roseus]